MNSYAVELAQSNRAAEAEQVAAVIAASPFISKYPEWQETVSEIAARRNRSSIVLVSVPKDEPRKIRDPRIQTAIESMETNFQRKISLDEARAISAPKFNLSS